LAERKAQNKWIVKGQGPKSKKVVKRLRPKQELDKINIKTWKKGWSYWAWPMVNTKMDCADFDLRPI
jgi:hypothetical protein